MDKPDKSGKKNGTAALVLLAVLAAGTLLPDINVSAEEYPAETAYNAWIYNNQNGMMSSDANVISETEDGCI